MSNTSQSESSKISNESSAIEESSINLASGYKVAESVNLESASKAGNSLNKNSIEILKAKNNNKLDLMKGWSVVAIGSITLIALLAITITSFLNNRSLKKMIRDASDYTEKEKIEEIKNIDSDFRDQETHMFLGIFLLAVGYFVGSSGNNKK